MKRNRGLRKWVAEAQDLKVLRRDAKRRQRRRKEKAEAVIVPMITDEDAALGSSVTDLSKTFTDERTAHTAPLK